MAGMSRSADGLAGRSLGRSARDLGISRPDSSGRSGSIGRQANAGSLGSLGRSSRGMGDIGRSSMADRSAGSMMRGSDSIARQISRPEGISSGRSAGLQRGMGDSIGRNGGDSVSRQVSRGGTTPSDRPVWRSNESVSRQISRGGSSERAMTRAPEISGRGTRSDSIGRTANSGLRNSAPISRPLDRSTALADAGGIRRGADLGRSLSRGMGRDSISRAGRSMESGSRSTGLGRSSSLSRSMNSVSRQAGRSGVSGSGLTSASRNSLRANDVHVVSAREFGGHGDHGFHGGHDFHHDGHWGHDFHGGRWDHHGWHGVEAHGWYGHHGWWHDYGWHCWPHRYWSFGFSFGCYSGPVLVDCGFSYVYPAYGWYPPVATYYSAYYWPTYCPPVVYTPVVAPAYTPVVVAPAYYYWYPAYAYYYAYPGVVAPAYAAPSTAVGVSVGVGADAGSAPADVAQPVAPDAAEGSVATAVQGDSLEQGLKALRNGQIEAAREQFSRAVSADPSSGVAQMLYTAALVADGQYKSATVSLRDALQTWSDMQLKDFYLPSVYGDAKSYSQYTRDLRAFLSDHPDRLDGWLLTIWASAFSGQSQEAAQLLAEARKTWPDDAALGALAKVIGRES